MNNIDCNNISGIIGIVGGFVLIFITVIWLIYPAYWSYRVISLPNGRYGIEAKSFKSFFCWIRWGESGDAYIECNTPERCKEIIDQWKSNDGKHNYDKKIYYSD